MDKKNITSIMSKIPIGCFIQIGAFDGITNESSGLYEKLKFENHKSVLIEPIPEHYNNLVINYNNSKSEIYFENIAVSDNNESKLISVDGQDSSFVRNTSENKILVECLTLNNIVKKYNIDKVNVLFIDVEGYEYEILNSFFNDPSCEIDVIRYEFWWLKDKEMMDNLLMKNGYYIFEDHLSYADKIAIKQSKINEYGD